MDTRWKELPLIEPVPVDDDLCTRLALIEDLGFGARYVLAHEQTCYESGTRILTVRRKIVLPYAAAREGNAMSAAFLAQRAAARAADLLQLVRG